VLRGEDVLHQLEGVGRVPVLHPLVGHDLDPAVVDILLEHLVLALAEEHGVVIGGAAAELHHLGGAVGGVVVSEERLHHAVGLLAADLDVVEGDVAGDLGALDQAVVGDHLHAGVGGLVHRGDDRVAVLGDDDQGLGALGDHVVDLVVLQLDVLVGLLGDHLVALLLEEPAHQHLLVLPALGGEVGEGEADRDRLA
jgi:hypothetical protein